MVGSRPMGLVVRVVVSELLLAPVAPVLVLLELDGELGRVPCRGQSGRFGGQSDVVQDLFYRERFGNERDQLHRRTAPDALCCLAVMLLWLRGSGSFLWLELLRVNCNCFLWFLPVVPFVSPFFDR